MEDSPAPTSSRSRANDVGAGRLCTPGHFTALPQPFQQRWLSWANPRMLWKSRRELIPQALDPTDKQRAAWVKGVPAADFDLDLPYADFSFVVMGDTGEGGHSQYAVTDALNSFAADTAFTVICGDVQYPAGDVNDYIRTFFHPYNSYLGAIYAVPGNHDWYDGLTAFMHHICAVISPKFDRQQWLRAGGPSLRALPQQQQPVPQRTPYFRIRTRHIALICIDAGSRTAWTRNKDVGY